MTSSFRDMIPGFGCDNYSKISLNLGLWLMPCYLQCRIYFSISKLSNVSWKSLRCAAVKQLLIFGKSPLDRSTLDPRPWTVGWLQILELLTSVILSCYCVTNRNLTAYEVRKARSQDECRKHNSSLYAAMLEVSEVNLSVNIIHLKKCKNIIQFYGRLLISTLLYTTYKIIAKRSHLPYT